MMNSFDILESSTSNSLKKNYLKPQFFSELELKRVITQLRKERILKKINKPSPIKILQIPLNTVEISVSNFSFEKITKDEKESGRKNEEQLRMEINKRENNESEGVKEDTIEMDEEAILKEESILPFPHSLPLVNSLSFSLPPKEFELNREPILVGNDWVGGEENFEKKSKGEQIKEEERKEEENQKPKEESKEIDEEKVTKDKWESEYNSLNYFFFEFAGEDKKIIKNLERRIEKLRKIREENESKARFQKTFQEKRNFNNIILEEKETEENDSPQEKLKKKNQIILSKEKNFLIQHLCHNNQLKEKIDSMNSKSNRNKNENTNSCDRPENMRDKSLFINTKKYLQSKEMNKKFFERFLEKNKEIINFLNKPLEEKKMEGNLKNEQIRKLRKERNKSKYFRSKSSFISIKI